MRTRRLATAGLVMLAPLALAMPSSQAAVPTCGGLSATIVGTDDPESLVGTEGPDVVALGAGNDTFSGKGGDDVICGGDGNDHLTPGGGDDVVHGGDGWDYVYAGPGHDRLDGGPGPDRLIYLTSGAENLNLDARTGKAWSSNGTEKFFSFGGFVGTPGADRLIGSKQSEFFDGGGFVDTIYSLGGHDRIVSRGNYARIEAGTGGDEVDVYDGSYSSHIGLGEGNDRITYRGSAKKSFWHGGPGVDTVYLRGGGVGGFSISLNQEQVRDDLDAKENWTVRAFENVIGSNGPDRIVGNSLPNRLEGRDGNDELLGLGSADLLLGNGGTDSADGGTNVDACYTELIVNC